MDAAPVKEGGGNGNTQARLRDMDHACCSRRCSTLSTTTTSALWHACAPVESAVLTVVGFGAADP